MIKPRRGCDVAMSGSAVAAGTTKTVTVTWTGGLPPGSNYSLGLQGGSPGFC